jgi:hypothetical protein
MWCSIILLGVVAILFSLLPEVVLSAQQRLFRRNENNAFSRGQRTLQICVLLTLLVVLRWAVLHCYWETRTQG